MNLAYWKGIAVGGAVLAVTGAALGAVAAFDAVPWRIVALFLAQAPLGLALWVLGRRAVQTKRPPPQSYLLGAVALDLGAVAWALLLLRA
jgi:hypothetical protein